MIYGVAMMIEGENVGRSPDRRNGRAHRPAVNMGGRPLSGMGRRTPVASEGFAKVVWRGRWILLVCLVLTLTAGFIHIETATPIYTSTSKLYLDYGGIPIVQSYETGRMPRADRYLRTQAELILSTPILGAVFENNPEILRLRTFANMDVPVAYMRKQLRVEVGKTTEIISVSFESPYAMETAQIANALIETYMDSRSDHEQRNSAQVLKILQQEMERARAELADKRSQLEKFQLNGMPLALGSGEGSGVLRRYEEIESTCTRLQVSAMEAASFRAGVEALAEDPVALRQYVAARGHVVPPMSAAGERVSLDADLRSAESELEVLQTELTPDNPRLAALERQIERITAARRELDDEFVKATLAAARQGHEEAEAYVAEVGKLRDEQRQEVVKLNAELTTYRTLNDEVSQSRGYYETVENQFREIRRVVGEDVGQFKMEILEAALVPREPSEPQKAKVMAFALVLGLMAGGGLAVLRDYLDQKLRSAEEISALLGLPILGVVPAMPRRQKVPTRGQRVHLEPDSMEAEAFRTVRTAIFFGASTEKAKTMLITSPAAGDGKSTLASNLAIAMAQAGQKTIIVDADFRKPMQHVIFELKGDKGGLSAVLTGKMELGQAIQRVEAKGLSVLSCGAPIPNPAEILNGRRFKMLLERLAEAYDRVIIDAPPVTVVADSQILGAICDVTVLVLRAEKSTRKISQRAMDSLRSVGADLLGAVVNDVRRNGDRYGYYGRHRNSNGSGRGSTAAAKASTEQDHTGVKRTIVSLPAGGRDHVRGASV